MVKCRQCRNVFHVFGGGLNAQLELPLLLQEAAQSIVEEFALKACHFRLLSRDLRTLDHVASYGLSQTFLNKGPIEAELSVAEALQGKAVMVLHCASDRRIQYPEACRAEGLASLLTVPLEGRGQVIGVMRLFTAEPREFTEDEIEFFRVVALFCTSAIIDAMFHQILGHVTQSIRSTLDLPVVLDTIVRVVCEDLRTRGCMISLVDRSTRELEPRASFGLSAGFVEILTRILSYEAVFAVLGGETVAILDGRGDRRVTLPREVEREKVSSILLIPLQARGQVIGVLGLFTHRPYRFSDVEKQLLNAIGEQCSLAIDNATMFAALKRRYDSLVDDFQLWFEHSQVLPR